MNGEKLHIAMESHFPFYIPAGYKGLETVNGKDILMLDVLAQVLNFTYQIVPSVDGTWGSRDGSNWSGMIGMLVRNEVDAAISGMTISCDRSKVVDFSTPYAFDRTTFVTKFPKPRSKTTVIFWPFTIEVWVALFSAVIFISVILYLLQNFCRRLYRDRNDKMIPKKLSFYNSLLYIFKTVMAQGGYNTTEESSRVLLTAWWIFVIITVTVYKGILMSFMANPGSSQAIDTVNSLVQAIKAGTISAGTIKDSAEYNMFKESSVDYMRVIFSSIESTSSHPVHHDSDGLTLVLQKPYAFIGGEMTVRADVWNPNNFLFAKDSFVAYGYGIAFRRGFHHIEMFTRMIHRMRQSGLLELWLQKMTELNQTNQDIHQDNQVLTIYDVQGAFLLLGCGLFFSFIALLTEIIRCSSNPS